ncbi:AI-2E family transporter [Noviherbaspirillum sp. ST9]|uniref:AI-2E family transporter n=1 Tax=Noviherbaspirillum sp. ST9 TaxID=3401606 RepID=UPI003B5890B1
MSLWLRGKLLSMTVVGAATAIGLTILGVPLALALGLVAGLLDFIPYIGPVLAAIPALLIAFSQGPMLALYVILLFIVLQLLEGYLLLPLIERKTVSMPPALTITMQVLMGLAFGLAGIALATPLTAVVAVLVAMLYVEDVLDDRVNLPAEKE